MLSGGHIAIRYVASKTQFTTWLEYIQTYEEGLGLLKQRYCSFIQYALNHYQ